MLGAPHKAWTARRRGGGALLLLLLLLLLRICSQQRVARCLCVNAHIYYVMSGVSRGHAS